MDEYGNEVAVGIIFDGPFVNAQEHEDISQVEQVVDVEYLNKHGINQLTWVAAEEECVSIQNEKEEDTDGVQEIKGQNIIKVYKVDNAVRKTLKRLKIDVKNKTKWCTRTEGKTKSAAKKSKICQDIAARKVGLKKAKRNLADKTFPRPSSMTKEELHGKFYF